MAILAVALCPDGVEATLGVARAVADPDNIDAEFGIVGRSDLKGSGLGSLLMRKLIGTLREQGTQRLRATVLTENTRMLALARKLGFVESRPEPAGSRQEYGTHEIHLMLQPRESAAASTRSAGHEPDGTRSSTQRHGCNACQCAANHCPASVAAGSGRAASMTMATACSSTPNGSAVAVKRSSTSTSASDASTAPSCRC